MRRGGRETVREHLHETMDERGIDVWVCPAAPGPAPGSITTTGNSVIIRCTDPRPGDGTVDGATPSGTTPMSAGVDTPLCFQ
ncbi:MAG: hypothetical protein V5A55_10360 [Halovenus sp.]